MKTNYDDVVKQSCDALAKTMSDMTYVYKETNVPKAHYKKLLSKQVEETIADSVSINMVNAYYKTLNEFNKGNRAWFVNALLCIELGVNPAKATMQELATIAVLTEQISGGKQTWLSANLVEQFEQQKNVD